MQRQNFPCKYVVTLTLGLNCWAFPEQQTTILAPFVCVCVCVCDIFMGRSWQDCGAGIAVLPVSIYYSLHIW